MIINQHNVELVFQGYKTLFHQGFEQAPSHYARIAMTVNSATRQETYGWLGNYPSMREWIGSRVVQNLSAYGFTIVNRKFEQTIEVNRDDIADDIYGVHGPMFAEMGRSAKVHPDQLVFALLSAGFTTPCYDGQNFFDTDHPVVGADGVTVSVSNSGGGGGSAWYLFDTSRGLRPIIWQVRDDYEFQRQDQPDNPRVFLSDRYLYGVRARVNAGFGLWQLAHASRQTLNAGSYANARAAMMAMIGEGGRPLGIMPDLLVVPPDLESEARKILNSEYASGGESNEWKGTADLIVTPWLGQ